MVERITSIVLILAAVSSTLRQRTLNLLAANSVAGALYMVLERRSVIAQFRERGFSFAYLPEVVNVVLHGLLPALLLSRTTDSVTDVRVEAAVMTLYVLSVDVRRTYSTQVLPFEAYALLYALTFSASAFARGASPQPVLLSVAGVGTMVAVSEFRRLRRG